MLVDPKVLNEVVVDRGPSSYLSNVDLFLDGHLITTVQGDGEYPGTLLAQRLPVPAHVKMLMRMK